MKVKRSINFKTLSYLIIFSVSILTLLWLFQIAFLNVFYERYQIKTVNNVAKSMLIKQMTQEKIEDIAYKYDMCIVAIESDVRYYYNNKMPTCILNDDNIATYYQSKYTKEFQTIKLINERFKNKGLLTIVNENTYSYLIYTDLEDVNTTTSILKSQLIYITLLAILLACIVSLYLSKKITSPIVEITNQAKKLGNGNYDIKFRQSGIREIDDLAQSLNYAEEKLSKIDELRRDLMANVSHDLKTPLTMIKAYAEMVKDISYNNEEKRNEHLNIIIDETNRLNILVNDILLLSKTQNAVEDLKKEKYDIVQEIKNIVSKYQIIKETEDYKIILNAPDRAIVAADKNKINQVIYNLINNAINYTGEDKTVIINVSSNKNRYKIEIIDTGSGIKKEDIAHIWDKYYTKSKNHKRNIVGTGLGLNIVKTILEKHNFKYGVKSKLKKGTTFYFYINK